MPLTFKEKLYCNKKLREEVLKDSSKTEVFENIAFIIDVIKIKEHVKKNDSSISYPINFEDKKSGTYNIPEKNIKNFRELKDYLSESYMKEGKYPINVSASKFQLKDQCNRKSLIDIIIPQTMSFQNVSDDKQLMEFLNNCLNDLEKSSVFSTMEKRLNEKTHVVEKSKILDFSKIFYENDSKNSNGTKINGCCIIL